MKYWHSSVLTVAVVATAVIACPAVLFAQVIAGRVTDDRTRQPAVDFVVRLVQTSDTGSVVLDETTTDPNGQFTVVAPSAGSYVLSFGRTAPRVHRFTMEVEAGVAPAPKDFSLPIQRESDTRPYVDVDVDSALVLHRRSAALQYPAVKRTERKSGSLFAMFVVDTTGHVEKNSVRLFAGSHEDFTKAADEWMRDAWFRLPSVGGVVVRRQVCLPITFVPGDAGRRTAVIVSPTLPAAGLANSARALCTRAINSNGILTISGQR